MHPLVGDGLILPGEALLLAGLPPESPDDPHAGQIFLGNGGQHALFFVAVQKGRADLWWNQKE